MLPKTIKMACNAAVTCNMLQVIVMIFCNPRFFPFFKKLGYNVIRGAFCDKITKMLLCSNSGKPHIVFYERVCYYKMKIGQHAVKCAVVFGGFYQ